MSDAPETPGLPEASPTGEAEKQESAAGRAAFALLAAVAAWIVPGLGHLILRKWGRALVFFSAVATLAFVGLYLRGNVFDPPNLHGNIFAAMADDLFAMLGFLADLGCGVFYFVAHPIQTAGPDISRAAGDYGTRMIAAAGVLNLLCVFDAHEIAQRRKG